MEYKMPLAIRVERDSKNEVIIIHLGGSLDGMTAPELDILIQKELSSPLRLMVLDMAKLDYISSVGIRSVLIALKKVKADDGRLALTNRQPQIVKVFEIMAALPDLKLFTNQRELDSYLTKIQNKTSR